MGSGKDCEEGQKGGGEAGEGCRVSAKPSAATVGARNVNPLLEILGSWAGAASVDDLDSFGHPWTELMVV